MTPRVTQFACCCMAMIFLPNLVVGQIRANKQKVDFRTPPRHYESKEYRGRTYQIETSLVRAAPKIAEKAVLRLHKNIDIVLKKFPKHTNADLSAVRYFIMHGPEAVGGGRPSGLAFIREKQPDRKQHLDPTWGNSIVVYCGKNYVNITDLWAQKSVAHELAHAHHLHRWPEKQADILAAYDAAMKQMLYRNVRNNKGGTIAEAYATVNQLEYFAELSSMYFVGCNYEPSNRRKLRQYDPRGYEMIEKMWAVQEGSVPPKSQLTIK